MRKQTGDINWKDKQVAQLAQSFVSLETSKEAEAFLRDLLTPEEIMEFSRRLETAVLLSKNVQYNAIIEKTGLSSTTIARISKWLRGPLGGYRNILNKMTLNKMHHHNQPKLGRGLS